MENAAAAADAAAFAMGLLVHPLLYSLRPWDVWHPLTVKVFPIHCFPLVTFIQVVTKISLDHYLYLP